MKKLVFTLILLVILAGVGFWGYNAVLNHQINVNHWFVGGLTRGVDVSAYQGEISMSRLKEQGIEFVYAKATEGSSYVDPNFAKNFAAAEAAGLPAGAYHFFSYESSGAAQAENFIAAVGSLEGRLIPVVDMELSKEQKAKAPEKSEVVSALRTFLAVIEEEYKVKPMIYATKDYYEKYLKDDFSSYPRWVRSVYWPVYIEAGGDWLVWQYDDHGLLDGYKGEEKYIDMNVINGNFGLDSLKMK
ncbi:hypothetical protein IKE83_02575 [Candidatus Saccharibacteria bacterium]|nr:hypothetical protein [Candidatus Saccharibacteria bacterium]